MSQEASSRYELVRLLGKGGFGDVWLAKDRDAGQEIALKFFRLANSGPQRLDFFKKEFQILSELRHQHLSRVFDFGYFPQQEKYYFTSEFCPGKTFFKAVEGRPPSYFEECLVQILAALDYIHSEGVVHFDIKGENILVMDRDGRPEVKLLDFGVAVRLRGTSAQCAAGTIPYLAPEILKQGPLVHHRADLTALDMLCFKALTGRYSFDADDRDGAIAWHRYGSLSPELWKGCQAPRYLQEVTEKLLKKNPTERFSSARVILNFLNLATRGRYREVERESAGRIPSHGPLVERSEVLEGLKKKFDGGSPSVVFLHGEEGIGKSRILEEMRHHAELNEVPFLDLTCQRESPAWPLIEAYLGLAPSDDPEASISDFLPGAGTGRDAWGTKERVDHVVESAKEKPVCLLLDDFQKADTETRRLVEGLRERVRMGAVPAAAKLFVMTAEESQGGGDLDLPRLTHKGVLNYLKLVLGESDANDPAAEAIHRYSGGLPLLMAESVRFLAPHLYRGESIEDLLPKADVGLLYEKRIEPLPRETKDLLNLMAVFFRPVQESELAKTLGADPGVFRDRLQLLIREGLVEGELTGTYQLSSQALALDLIRLLAPEEKALLHRRIADGLDRLQTAPSEEVAFHMARGGKEDEALRLYKEEADRFAAEGRTAAACRCLVKARELEEEGSEEWQELTLKSARLLILTGAYQQARENLQRLGSFPSSAFWEMKGTIAYKERDFPSARENFEKAIALIPHEGSLRRILLRNAVGNVELQAGNRTEAERIFRETLVQEEALEPENRVKVTNNGLGLLLSLKGDRDGAVRLYRERLERIGTARVAERITLLNGLGFALLQGARWEEGIRHLREALALAESSGALAAVFSILGNLTYGLMKEARYADCLPLLRKTISYQERFGSPRDVAFNFLRLGGAYLRLNMEEAAAECFEKGRRLAESTSDEALTAWFVLMEGCRLRETGDTERAHKLLEASFRMGEELQDAGIDGWGRYLLAEMSLDRNDDASCLRFIEGDRTDHRDEELVIRTDLLRVRMMIRKGERVPALEILTQLENRCLEQRFHETLSSVYHTRFKAESAMGRMDEAERQLEKGIQIIESLAEALPEEFRDRYRRSRERLQMYEDWEKVRPGHLKDDSNPLLSPHKDRQDQKNQPEGKHRFRGLIKRYLHLGTKVMGAAIAVIALFGPGCPSPATPSAPLEIPSTFDVATPGASVTSSSSATLAVNALGLEDPVVALTLKWAEVDNLQCVQDADCAVLFPNGPVCAKDPASGRNYCSYRCDSGSTQAERDSNCNALGNNATCNADGVCLGPGSLCNSVPPETEFVECDNAGGKHELLSCWSEARKTDPSGQDDPNGVCTLNETTVLVRFINCQKRDPNNTQNAVLFNGIFRSALVIGQTCTDPTVLEQRFAQVQASGGCRDDDACVGNDPFQEAQCVCKGSDGKVTRFQDDASGCGGGNGSCCRFIPVQEHAESNDVTGVSDGAALAFAAGSDHGLFSMDFTTGGYRLCNQNNFTFTGTITVNDQTSNTTTTCNPFGAELIDDGHADGVCALKEYCGPASSIPADCPKQ